MISDRVRIWVSFGIGAVAAVAAGVALSGLVDPLLIWGGSDCEVVNGMRACFGYPPSGILILVLLVGWPVFGVVDMGLWRLTSGGAVE